MQRNVIAALAVLVFLLASALAFVLLRSPGGAPARAPVNLAEENVVEPYHQEMDCIDRLLESNGLAANEVQPALARCQSGSSGNQSLGR
jgi:hypothetical protein